MASSRPLWPSRASVSGLLYPEATSTGNCHFCNSFLIVQCSSLHSHHPQSLLAVDTCPTLLFWLRGWDLDSVLCILPNSSADCCATGQEQGRGMLMERQNYNTTLLHLCAHVFLCISIMPFTYLYIYAHNHATPTILLNSMLVICLVYNLICFQ